MSDENRFRLVDFESETSTDVNDGHRETHRRLSEKISPEVLTPHIWQAAVAHEILKRKDDVLKAGTGSGKTLAFQAVCLLKPNKCVLVVSPLNALMGDQVSRAVSLGITAACVNAETLAEDRGLLARIRDGGYQMTIVSAESTDVSDENWKKITGKADKPTEFSKRLIAIVIDEAHLVRDWKEFRPYYRNLGILRVRWRRVPILACSGTLPTYYLHYLHKSMGMHMRTILCELDTDRPNITMVTAPIPTGEVASRKTLEWLVPDELRNLRPEDDYDYTDIPKTIVFVDNKMLCCHLTTQLLLLLPEWMRAGGPDSNAPAFLMIREYHADISPCGRALRMESFRSGVTRLLIATDAVGMGVDIPDVHRVIQWKIPRHLSICGLYQRFGRAGRNGDLAIAIAYFEPSLRHRGDLEADIEKPEECVLVRSEYLPLDVEARKDGETTITAGDRRPAGETHEQYMLWALNTAGCCRRVFLEYIGSKPSRNSRYGAHVCCDRHAARAGVLARDVMSFPIKMSVGYLNLPDSEAGTPETTGETPEPTARTQTQRLKQVEVETNKRVKVAVEFGLYVYRQELCEQRPHKARSIYLADMYLPDAWIDALVKECLKINGPEEVTAILSTGKFDKLKHSLLAMENGVQRLGDFITWTKENATPPEIPPRANGMPYIMTQPKPMYAAEIIAIQSPKIVRLMKTANEKLSEFDLSSHDKRENARASRAASGKARSARSRAASESSLTESQAAGSQAAGSQAAGSQAAPESQVREDTPIGSQLTAEIYNDGRRRMRGFSRNVGSLRGIPEEAGDDAVEDTQLPE